VGLGGDFKSVCDREIWAGNDQLLVSRIIGQVTGAGHCPRKALIRHKVVLTGPLRSRTRANVRPARYPRRRHTLRRPLEAQDKRATDEKLKRGARDGPRPLHWREPKSGSPSTGGQAHRRSQNGASGPSRGGQVRDDSRGGRKPRAKAPAPMPTACEGGPEAGWRENICLGQRITVRRREGIRSARIPIHRGRCRSHGADGREKSRPP
jgi:hypothetical protein